MTDDAKLAMKRILCKMEGDPEQIDNYLITIRDGPDGEERVNCAWDIIRKVYEEESLVHMEEYGLLPPEGYGQDEDDDDGSDEDDNNDNDTDDDDSDNGDPGSGDDDEDDKDSDNREDDGNEDADGDSGNDADGDENDGEGNTDVRPDERDLQGRKDDSDTGDKDHADEENGDHKVKEPPKEEIAGVQMVIPENRMAPVMPTPEAVDITASALSPLRKAGLADGPEGKALYMDGDRLPAGTNIVYVVPGDTGREVEVRVMELRVSTDENLALARKIHEEIARSVAEERKIRDNMYELVVSYQELAERLAGHEKQAAKIKDSLLEGVSKAERFMDDDMARMLQQRAKEATNDFYQESKDYYNGLFKSAVKRYKQFTEAAMDFQEKMSDENARRVRTIESRLGMVEKVSYAVCALTALNIVFSVVNKIFG